MKVYTSISSVPGTRCAGLRLHQRNYTLPGAGQGHPPVPESKVQVFYVEGELPAHTRIALLHRSLDMSDIACTNPGKLVAMLRKQAGALGVNGIVMAGVKEPGDRMWVVIRTQFSGHRLRDWKAALNQFVILYGDRVPIEQ